VSTLRFWVIATAIGLSVCQAKAGTMLVEEYTGSFGPTTTLGGVALGADTGFSIQAEFDPTTNVFPNTGIGIFAVTNFTIDIAGKGVFTGIPTADLNVLLIDPSGIDNQYLGGLSNSDGTLGFDAHFNTATPPFNAKTPTPSTLSDFTGNGQLFPYNISLVGVSGGLVVNDLGNAIPTVALVAASAVPEPSSLALAGTAALAGLGLLTRHRCARRPHP
jgi:hypothetical protein